MQLPLMTNVRQHFPSAALADPLQTLRRELLRLDLRPAAGARIGVAAGSRGIANIAAFTRAVVDYLVEVGAAPFVLPAMGSIYDSAKIKLAGGEAAFNALQGDALNNVLGAAAQQSFFAVAALPAILLVVFGAIWLYDRSTGGFKPTKI